MASNNNCEKQIDTLSNFSPDNLCDGFRSLRKESLELFGSMREATEEEIDSVRQYIDSISVDTGINVFDLMDKKEKHAD